ncbi:MAG: condensation domain-containing protein, partial [Flammeovirgaceae bacterium]
MSSGQSRLWFLDRLDPGNPAYNICAAYSLLGLLRPELLIEAFCQTIRRHESLRTIFRVPGDQPRQYIREFTEDYMPRLYSWEDLSARYKDVNDFIHSEATYRFDLSRDALIHITIVRQKPQDFILIIAMHHIISDAWSLEVMLNEVITNYKGLLSDAPAGQTAALRFQYKDYSTWQSGLHDSDLWKKMKTFWLSKFSGTLPVLDLPVDMARPSKRTNDGRSARYRFSSEYQKAILDIAGAGQNSAYTLLQTLVYLFLHKLTGEGDIVIGVPVSGREHFVL